MRFFVIPQSLSSLFFLFALFATLLPSVVLASDGGSRGSAAGQRYGYGYGDKDHHYYPSQPKPSSTPGKPGWSCPDQDHAFRSKIEEFCDKPPHKGSQFGCTYHDGHGGNYVCSFDSKTGECTGGGEHCPKNAHWHDGKKREEVPVPAPTPTATVPVLKHRAARHLHKRSPSVMP